MSYILCLANRLSTYITKIARAQPRDAYRVSK